MITIVNYRIKDCTARFKNILNTRMYSCTVAVSLSQVKGKAVSVTGREGP
jgi:hypothetical protein